MCCGNYTTQADHDKQHKGQCPECENDVDADGDSIMLDDCSYSPLLCKTCGYRPCDQSC